MPLFIQAQPFSANINTAMVMITAIAVTANAYINYRGKLNAEKVAKAAEQVKQTLEEHDSTNSVILQDIQIKTKLTHDIVNSEKTMAMETSLADRKLNLAQAKALLRIAPDSTDAQEAVELSQRMYDQLAAALEKNKREGEAAALKSERNPT